MSLSETLRQVSPSVVAFVSKVRGSRDGTKPLCPLVFGTGFFIHKDGIVATNRHVVEAFKDLPDDPRTGKTSAAALLFHPYRTEQGRDGRRVMIVDLRLSTSVNSILEVGKWFGNNPPDIGLVQVKLRNVPALELATEDYYVRPGMPIATAGYPLGDTPLTALGRLNQFGPFVRRGIVSSVFPFEVPQPHGFTIDIMQQGGSSGSPVFDIADARVVGMMASSVLEWNSIESDQLALAVAQNTNISICEPAAKIREALNLLFERYAPSLEGVPTLEEHLARQPVSDAQEWERIQEPHA